MKIPAVAHGIVMSLAAWQVDEGQELRHIYEKFAEKKEELEPAINWLCSHRLIEIIKVRDISGDGWGDELFVVVTLAGWEHVMNHCHAIQDSFLL
jgi:hypothetical protein